VKNSLTILENHTDIYPSNRGEVEVQPRGSPQIRGSYFFRGSRYCNPNIPFLDEAAVAIPTTFLANCGLGLQTSSLAIV